MWGLNTVLGGVKVASVTSCKNAAKNTLVQNDTAHHSSRSHSKARAQVVTFLLVAEVYSSLKY